MWPFTRPFNRLVQHPARFALQVIRAFRANQGLLLAAALAYYALLSIVPLLILVVFVLSHFFDQAELLTTLGRALEWVAPGQSRAVVQELADFLDARVAVGWVLLGTMLFFSSLAFTVLENAMSVIFMHRLVERKRRFLVSALIPLAYIFFISLALLVGTFVQASLGSIGQESFVAFGHTWHMHGLSGGLLYACGVFLEILLITSVYLVMPFGRLSLLHALIGGTIACLLWELIRHGLIWYFGHISQVSVVYGSLSSVIVVLLSFEIGATLLLFGAQVIAEYERLARTAKG